jgi:hypothetical protein
MILSQNYAGSRLQSYKKENLRSEGKGETQSTKYRLCHIERSPVTLRPSYYGATVKSEADQLLST